MSHTSEPWSIHDNGVYIELCGNNEKIGDVCASKYHRDEDENEVDFSRDNARRIVACVNACAGLSTDDLEKSGLISAVGNELLLIEKERDTYRDLCSEILKLMKAANQHTRDGKQDSAYLTIDLAIKKAGEILGEKNAT